MLAFLDANGLLPSPVPIIHYTGNSTTSLQNDWSGGASVAGALYGDTSPYMREAESTSISINHGDTTVTGANDFYMAEGIYLLD